jgi:hypothetical protein
MPQCLFVSWDAASWHASKTLYKVVGEIDSDAFRTRHKTPLVDLMPLPSGAQFLNVIEAVFSGMARAILHNSNYQSVFGCKEAIDRYVAERNQAFLEHPRRAGNKIWGKEPAKAKIMAGSSSLQFDPYAARRLPARRQHHRRTLIDRRCGRPMKADSVGFEGVEPIPTTALLHRGGLPTTIQLSHRSELGSGKRAVRKWCSRRRNR